MLRTSAAILPKGLVGNRPHAKHTIHASPLLIECAASDVAAAYARTLNMLPKLLDAPMRKLLDDVRTKRSKR
jgi:hypothetical protein